VLVVKYVIWLNASAVKIAEIILADVVLIVILSNVNAVLIADAILANVVMYQI
jgi:hypothetical protein